MEQGAYFSGFYECTPAEISDLIKSEIKRRENEDRSRAVFAWHTAYLTGLAVNCPKHFPDSPASAFPFIEGATPEERSKRDMRRFMEQHNKKYQHKAHAGNFSREPVKAE